MSWQDYYKSHVMSAQDAAKILQSGDCFWFPLLMGQPSMLIPDAIADRKDELKVQRHGGAWSEQVFRRSKTPDD